MLATKFGIVREDSGYGRRIDNSPDYIRKAVDASLSRLRTDVIDLYYAHRLERGRPVEEIVDTLAGLVKAGKVRAIGLSGGLGGNPAPRGSPFTPLRRCSRNGRSGPVIRRSTACWPLAASWEPRSLSL